MVRTTAYSTVNQVSTTDTGNYYTDTNVEILLQEISTSLDGEGKKVKNKSTVINGQAETVNSSDSTLTRKAPTGSSGGDMYKATYDKNNNGIVDVSETANSVVWSSVTGKPTSTVANIDTAVINSHTHSNKSTLENITASYTTAEQTKLSSIETGANKYVHPSGDGYLHVPATGISNNGKVLTAGATAGSLSWQTPAGGGTSIASNVSIDDIGSYYTGTNVEAVLQEVGKSLDDIVYYNNSMVINGLCPMNGLAQAHGDGITNDLIIIQNLINYIYSHGGGTLFLPPTNNGYYIDGEILYKDNVKLIGLNTKMIFKSSNNLINGFYNFTDNLDNIHIEGFNFSTTQDKSYTDSYGTYNVSNIILFHFKNAVKVQLKDIKANGFTYTLKTDGDGVINELITTNITGVNCIMFFHLSGVLKWIGNNLDSTLCNTTQLNHHYYLKEDLRNIQVDSIKATDGVGWVFHLYSSASGLPNDSINNVIFKNITCTNIGGYAIFCCPCNNVKLIDSTINNIKIKTNPMLYFYGTVATNIIVDGFDLTGGSMLFESVISNKVRTIKIRNGIINDKMAYRTVFSNVSDLTLDNIEYKDATWLNSTTTHTLVFNAIDIVDVRNIRLHFPSGAANTDAIRIYGRGKYYLNNIFCTTDGIANGQFIYLYGTADINRFVVLSNCYVDTFNSFVYSDSADVAKKSNCWFKGNSV